VLKAQGNLPDRLAKADPGNAGWQRDLSVSYDRVGDVLVPQGNLPEALTSFRDGLAIRDRLVKADPGNAGRHRVLPSAMSALATFIRAWGRAPRPSAHSNWHWNVQHAGCAQSR
jgi:hypothetical protein